MATVAFDKASLPKQCMIQNYLVIWIDSKIDEKNDDYCYTLEQLHCVVNQVTICREAAQCIKYLNDMDGGQAFVISSGALGQDLVPKIHGIACVNSIYIFCGNKDWHEQWAKKWAKIEGVFTSIKPICESLKNVARQVDHNEISMSLIPKHILTEIKTTTEENKLDELPASYMYSTVFKNIILNIDEDDRKRMQDFINHCQSKGVSDSQLKFFEKEYNQHSAVWWYTCEIFLYGMLNYVLRTLDMDIMIKMGFFIRNLHQQLQELYKQQLDSLEEQFIVYRGQALTPEHFSNLHKTEGGLLAFNNFLSTSTEPSVAKGFIKRALRKDENCVAVLFIIKIDLKKKSATTTPFALIQDFSAIKTEKEILFSMHSVFRVGEIKQSTENKRVWEVQLTLTDDRDSKLTVLMEYLEMEIRGKGWDRMGELMIQMHRSDQAEILYNELLENATNENDRAHFYHQMGKVKSQQRHHEQSIEFFEKSLKIKERILEKNDVSLAYTYSGLANGYHELRNFSKALEFQEKSLKIKEKALPSNHPNLSTSYYNLGQYYCDIGQYSKALEFHEKSLKIREKTLPSNHSLLAASYNDIGELYRIEGNYAKALEFHEKSLKIKEKTLPSNHPDLAVSYNNIGITHKYRGEYSKALEYYNKAHQIREQVLPPHHPSLATSYNNIGGVYKAMGDYMKALEFYEKALEIDKKIRPSNHPDLACSYSNIAGVYSAMGDYSKALEFYEKALEIDKKAHSSDHPDLACSYNSIATVYYNMNNYSTALEYYVKALKIREKALSPNHPDLASVYNSIGSVYYQMDDYSKAYEFLEKALKIREKTLPENHPDLASSYSSIAAVYRSQGDYSKTLELLERVRQILEQTLPANHPKLGLFYNNIGMTYFSKGDYSKAISFLEKALNILQQTFSLTHPDVKLIKDNIIIVKNHM
jgi:tetratricopeptide (TPR) repeat protein